MSSATQESPTNAVPALRFAILLPFLLAWSFGLVLVVLLCLGLVSQLFPQQPPYLTPHEIEIWLLSVQHKTPYTRWLYRMGFFAVTRTLLFRGLILSAILLSWLHVAYAAYLSLWPRKGGPVPPLHPIAGEGGHLWHLKEPLDTVKTRIKNRLHPLPLVAEMHPSFQEARYFFRIGHGGAWGSITFFIGVILFLSALYWGLTHSWVTRPVVLVPGRPWTIKQARSLQIILHHVDRAGTRPRAHILVQSEEEGGNSQGYTLLQGQTLRVRKLYIRYLDTLVGLSLEAVDREGTPVPVQPPEGGGERQVILLFPESGTERLVFLPTQGIHIRVVGYTSLPQRGFSHPVFLVQLLDETGELLYSDFIDKEAHITVHHITVHVKPTEGVRFQAFAYPGASARALGFLLVIIGFLWALFKGPLRRLWIQVFGNERTTIVQGWGDVYNVGWHKPMRRNSIRKWVVL